MFFFAGFRTQASAKPTLGVWGLAPKKSVNWFNRILFFFFQKKKQKALFFCRLCHED
jgi:hypothetical protein